MSNATHAPTPTSGNDDTKEPRAQMLKQLAQPACDISREQWDVGFEGLLRHLNIDVVVVNVILPPEKRAVYGFAVGRRSPGADGGGAETFIERS